MAKVIKSFSLPEDVAEYLEGQVNASAEVTRLVRRRMLTSRAEEISGHVPTPEVRDKARAWARRELTAAHDAVEGGAYDEVREHMGWAA